MTIHEGKKWPEALALAERLLADSSDTVRAVLLYGSRLLKTNPDAHSALDFVVIVEEYRPFYAGLARSGELQRPVGLMTALAGVLAPNVLAYGPEGGRYGLVKCLVISKDDLAKALGPTPPDHFVLGRLVQQVGLVWAADQEHADWVRAQLRGAHERILDWMAPYLDRPFDAAELGQRLLEVCYAGEIRPESRERPRRVFEVQAEHFEAALRGILEGAVAKGTLARAGDRYALAAPAPARERRRWRRHFRRSKARTTLRWFKHAITFSNWLPYLVRKVERHTGRTIRLTILERKLPVIFIWPRVVHVLLTRPTREIES